MRQLKTWHPNCISKYIERKWKIFLDKDVLFNPERSKRQMSKKVITAVLAIFMSVCFIGTGLAMEQGNKRKGKYTYRKVYKACHEHGKIDNPKPTLNPDAKTQAGWEEMFDAKAFDEFGCQEEWSQLSDTEITDIFTYLHAHASDSPTPAKCK